MADKQSSMTIIFKAEDQASDRAGKIFSRMTKDQAEYERAAFASSHSARETELRDVDEFYSQRMEKLKRQAAAMEKAEADARTRLQEATAKRSGVGHTAEERSEFKKQAESARAELDRIQQMRDANAKAQVGGEEAKAARLDEIERQRQEQLAGYDRKVFDARATAKEREIRNVTDWRDKELRNAGSDAEAKVKINAAAAAQIEQIEANAAAAMETFWTSKKGLKIMAGGFKGLVAGELAMGAFSMGQAHYASAGAQTSDEAISARIQEHDAATSLVSWMPIVGPLFTKALDAGFNKAGLENLGKRLGDSAQKFQALEGSMTGIASHIETMRADIFGFTASDRAGTQSEVAARERAARMRSVSETEWQTRQDVTAAQTKGISGAPLEELRQRSAQAQAYLAIILQIDKQEAEYSQHMVERSKEIERTAFGRAMAGRQRGTDLALAGPDLAARFSHDKAELTAANKAELEDLDRSIKTRTESLLTVDKWQQEWKTRQMSARTFTGMTQPEFDRIQQEVEKEAPKAYMEAWGRVTELRGQRSQVAAAQEHGVGAMDFQQSWQQRQIGKNFDRESQMAGLDTTLRSTARARELKGVDYELADQLEQLKNLPELKAKAEALAAEKKLAINRKYTQQEGDLFKELHLRQLDLDAQAEGSARAAHDRNIARIEARAEIERRAVKDKPEDVARVNALESLEKRLADRDYAHAGRDQSSSFLSQGLRMAGKGHEAFLEELKNRYQKEQDRITDEAGGGPLNEEQKARMNVLNGRKAVEEAQYDYQNRPKRETQAIESRFASRIAGFDNGGPEAKLLMEVRKLLEDGLKVWEAIRDKPGFSIKKVNTPGGRGY